MVWNVFNFRWGTLQMFQNALRMFLNAFQRFEMRCAEKRLNANFVKPVFPKDGHILRIINALRSINKVGLMCYFRDTVLLKSKLPVPLGIYTMQIARCAT